MFDRCIYLRSSHLPSPYFSRRPSSLYEVHHPSSPTGLLRNVSHMDPQKHQFLRTGGIPNLTSTDRRGCDGGIKKSETPETKYFRRFGTRKMDSECRVNFT